MRLLRSAPLRASRGATRFSAIALSQNMTAPRAETDLSLRRAFVHTVVYARSRRRKRWRKVSISLRLLYFSRQNCIWNLYAKSAFATAKISFVSRLTQHVISKFCWRYSRTKVPRSIRYLSEAQRPCSPVTRAGRSLAVLVRLKASRSFYVRAYSESGSRNRRMG
jgi:hypothetical protein